MVGSFVRFFFTRCEELLNSLVRSRLSQLVKKNRPHSPTRHEVTSIYFISLCSLKFIIQLGELAYLEVT